MRVLACSMRGRIVFPANDVGLIVHMQKNEVGPLVSYHIQKLRQIKCLNIRAKTIRRLEET